MRRWVGDEVVIGNGNEAEDGIAIEVADPGLGIGIGFEKG